MATELTGMPAVKCPLSIRKHVVIGVSAGFLLLIVYVGIITLAQGASHVLEQTGKLWFWLAILAAGFGVQAGLFSFIRQVLKERRKQATASLAASGGVSAGSMVACCAHHLGDVLPLIGVVGLTAFLVKFQTYFIILGVLSNVVGITVMLETIQRHNLCPIVSGWNWDMGMVKRVALTISGLILLTGGFRILLEA